jgi:hypothetical protein
MTSYLLMFGLPCLPAIVAGAVAGGITAKLRSSETVPPPLGSELSSDDPEDDQFVDAEIDLAAVQWAEANNQPPEAAGLMAERLRTLRKISKQKGWA